MDESWHVTRSWDSAAEAEFGQWVQTIGRAVEARRCRTLASCLDSPSINPLYVSGRRSTFRADCGDVPYILRAYFAWRRQLPFLHTASVRGERASRDGRYSYTNRPASTRRWSDYATPRRLLHDIGSAVHSGFFRMRPELDDSDTYPVRVDRGAIHPGTAFYDPDGHVLTVYEVRPDGEIRLIDGHPGGSFTSRRFSSQLTLGSSRQGGGFRNFRPMLLRRGAIPPHAPPPWRDHPAPQRRARRLRRDGAARPLPLGRARPSARLPRLGARPTRRSAPARRSESGDQRARHDLRPTLTLPRPRR